jgi:hypothetical protein
MAITRIFGAMVICAAPFILANAAAAESAETGPGALPRLAPYRAVYDLSLSHTTGAGAPASARGRIAFDFSGSACQGYLENIHQVTELQPADGPARVTDLHSATFESGDGKGFDFKIVSKLNNGPAENTYGKAKKTAGAALSVTLASPQRQRVNLDGAVLFPSEHLRRVLGAAQADEKVFAAKVYDASADGQKILDTMAIVGKARTGPVPEKAAQIEQMKNLPRWPVTISYFEPGAQDGAPLYTISFELYENGVVRALKLDYGDFALAGEMTQLALSPSPTACNK